MSSSAPTLSWLPVLLRQKSKLLLPPHLPSAASSTITLLLTHSIPSTLTLLLCRESTSHEPSSGPQDMLFPLSCMFQCGFLDHVKIITPIPYIAYPPSLLYFSCSTCQHLTYKIFNLPTQFIIYLSPIRMKVPGRQGLVPCCLQCFSQCLEQHQAHTFRMNE